MVLINPSPYIHPQQETRTSSQGYGAFSSYNWKLHLHLCSSMRPMSRWPLRISGMNRPWNLSCCDPASFPFGYGWSRSDITSTSPGFQFRWFWPCSISTNPMGQCGKPVKPLEEGCPFFFFLIPSFVHQWLTSMCWGPELEGNLRNIFLALQEGSPGDASRTPPDMILMERGAPHFRRLNDEWLEAVEETRLLEDSQDILHPSRISTLLRAANKLPVIILNASDTGCAALTLTYAGVFRWGLAYFRSDDFLFCQSTCRTHTNCHFSRS